MNIHVSLHYNAETEITNRLQPENRCNAINIGNAVLFVSNADEVHFLRDVLACFPQDVQDEAAGKLFRQDRGVSTFVGSDTPEPTLSVAAFSYK